MTAQVGITFDLGIGSAALLPVATIQQGTCVPIGGPAVIAAPTITIVSPTPGAAPGGAGGFPSDWNLARVTPIVVEIDGANLTFASLVARYPLANDHGDPDIIERVVYRRGAIRTGFTQDSTAVQVTATKLRLTVLPNGGWPSSRAVAEIAFSIDAVAGGALSLVGASS